MVGGGQLARMSHQAAIALGQSLRVLAASPGDPAALVCADVHLGSPDDLDALRGLARDAEAVTFDHEGVPGELLRMLVAEGVAVHPGPDALLHAQDKLVMRRALAGIAGMPAYVEVADTADVEGLAARTGWPVVLKAVRGGYDGRGVWLLDGPDPALVAQLLASGTPLMVEQAVTMRRELAVQVARSPCGQAAAWPVVETVQRDGQCVEVLAPAPGLDPATAAAAQELALRIAARLGVTGLLAVELFDTDGTAAGLVVNELAMRPHNSGHWTIEGARTSQFEQHLRAVLDYPLGATEPTAPVVVMANVLGAAAPVAMPRRRAGAPPVRPVPRRQDPPLRQGGAPGPQGRARDGAGRRARRGAGAGGAGRAVAVDGGVGRRVVALRRRRPRDPVPAQGGVPCRLSRTRPRWSA